MKRRIQSVPACPHRAAAPNHDNLFQETFQIQETSMASIRLGLTAALALTLLVTLPAFADPLGSAITYQGRLKNAGSPANGPHTMEFRLFSVPSGGSQVGPTLIHDGNILPQITVTNGLFTVELDFGASLYNGDKRWLDITVDGIPLTPRQELTPAPHARFSAAPWLTNGADIAYPIGNVGIGTTTPGYPLSLANTLGDKISLFGDPPFYYGFGIQGNLLQIHTDSANSDIAFGHGISVGLTETMRIKGNGNVGIGTSSPASKLDIHDGAMRLSNSADSKYYELAYDSVEDYFYIDEDGAARRFVIKNGGDVGVGTTVPTARLHIAGGPDFNHARIESDDAVGTWLNLENTDTNGREWALVASGPGNVEGPGKLLFVDRAAGTVRMTIDTSGNVGIGNASPEAPLSFASILGEKIIMYGSSGNNFGFGIQGASMQIHTDLSSSDVTFGFGSSASLTETMRIKGTGRVGIGTPAPAAQLHTVGGPFASQVRFESADTAGTWTNIVNTSAGGHQWSLVSTGSGNAEGPGKLLIRNQTAGTTVLTAESNGDVTVSVLEITGGSDIAEPFNVNSDPVAAADERSNAVAPGMVVCIDPQRTGELKLCSSANDRTVAGVISGAGGVKPGMLLRQSRTVADGRHPVALTGRVYCWVDADAGGPVKPGDLLTTSGTPGHAMKVSDRVQAQGAVLGKAMSSLNSGTGLVFVLVTLQ
jgi:hypothetical protein